MTDKLGQIMSDFSLRVRLYKTREMAQIETAAGLTERDLVILECVYEKGQATFAQIAHALAEADMPKTSASTISQAISALYMKEGLLEKQTNPSDQRQPIITLTAKGNVMIENIKKFRYEYFAKIRDAMELSNQELEVIEKGFTRGIDYFDKLLNQTAHN